MENKKFEFTEETKTTLRGVTVKGIVALRDFGDVKAGDKGGFLEKEENLSHDNDCWVCDEARVYGEARVYDEARVYGEAQVYDEARVYDEAQVYGVAQVYGEARVFGEAREFGVAQVYGVARVFGEAQVYGVAQVFGEARVYGEAWVCGEARVYGEAQVCDKARATTVVKTFGNGFDYRITVTDKHIKIGCQQHLKSEWLNFQEGEIIEMDGKRALEFWGMFKPLAKQLGLFEEI